MTEKYFVCQRMHYFWGVVFKSHIKTPQTMHLSAYSGLIRHLPHLDQAFATRRETWKRTGYRKNKDFQAFLEKTFANRKVVAFSREDLFRNAKKDFKTAVFSIIFWGYPRNMRGNSFDSILKALPDIEVVLSSSRKLDLASYAEICKQLKGKGIGLSTLTKFLYFFGFSLDGYECLILDSRIIEVLRAGMFSELTPLESITEANKEKMYPKYLMRMHEIAKNNRYPVDQLELFLFQFGLNLKSAST